MAQTTSSSSSIKPDNKLVISAVDSSSGIVDKENGSSGSVVVKEKRHLLKGSGDFCTESLPVDVGYSDLLEGGHNADIGTGGSHMKSMLAINNDNINSPTRNADHSATKSCKSTDNSSPIAIAHDNQPRTSATNKSMPSISNNNSNASCIVKSSMISGHSVDSDHQNNYDENQSDISGVSGIKNISLEGPASQWNWAESESVASASSVGSFSSKSLKQKENKDSLPKKKNYKSQNVEKKYT